MASTLTLKEALDRGQIDDVSTALGKVSIGSILAAMATPINENVTTVTSHVGTLAYPAMYVLGVFVDAGSATGVFTQVPDGTTVATKMFKVDYTAARATVTFFATDAVTAFHVCYVKKPAALATNLAAVYGV